LDTASAVDLDYGAERRLLVLRQGALMLRTAHGDARPLLVQSAQGTVQALGTVFTVRQFDGRTRVGVVEGQVRLAPRAGAARTLATGLSADFDAAGVAEPNVPAHPSQAWAEGVLYADDWRLDDVVRELGRYRAGILRCDPAVAGLRLSGAFQLDDTDAALLAVARSLPVSVVYRTRYWVTLTAA
ncbi:MAG: FecR domain-containing protein, partial [Bordetella sp.]|nr:FecR domain-containing protein [Bordetella sp.]